MTEGQETVTVEGSFSPSDYWRGSQYLRNRSPRIWFFKAVVIVGPLFILLYRYRIDPEGWTWWLWLVPAYFVLFLLLIAPLINRVFLQRRMKSIPSAFSPQSFVFSDEGMEITSQTEHADLKWAAIIKAAESSTDFFLYVGSNMAHSIPKRFLPSSAQQLKLREILKRNLGSKVKF